MEKQYTLNNSERSQSQSWIDQYGPLNYDPAQTGGSTIQLFLSGRGSHQASADDVQQLTSFATAWATKIASGQ